MWTSSEDARRYQDLTKALIGILKEEAPAHGDERVQAEHLAMYLEWLELAREAAHALTAFVDKSSPYHLRDFTYRQMELDFHLLRDRLHGADAEAMAALRGEVLTAG